MFTGSVLLTTVHLFCPPCRGTLRSTGAGSGGGFGRVDTGLWFGCAPHGGAVRAAPVHILDTLGGAACGVPIHLLDRATEASEMLIVPLLLNKVTAAAEVLAVPLEAQILWYNTTTVNYK